MNIDLERIVFTLLFIAILANTIMIIQVARGVEEIGRVVIENNNK